MLNKVMLIGNLGGNPEARSTNGGEEISNFSLATTYGFGEKAKTEWHRITVFGKGAAACNEYLSKGSRVYVEGRIQSRSFEDKDGNKRYIAEIIANDVKFMSSKAEGKGKPDQDPDNMSGYDSADDMPF